MNVHPFLSIAGQYYRLQKGSFLVKLRGILEVIYQLSNY